MAGASAPLLRLGCCRRRPETSTRAPPGKFSAGAEVVSFVPLARSACSLGIQRHEASSDADLGGGDSSPGRASTCLPTSPRSQRSLSGDSDSSAEGLAAPSSPEADLPPPAGGASAGAACLLGVAKSSEVGAVGGASQARPHVGDVVVVTETGETGEVLVVDEDELPFKVLLSSGRADWFKEGAVVCPQLEAAAPASPAPWPRWCAAARPEAVPGLESAPRMSQLLEARILWHSGERPWQGSEAIHEVYGAMGMRDPTRRYVAVWLNLGAASLLSVSEVQDVPRFEDCLKDGCMLNRLKFIVSPVELAVPLPSWASRPREADFVSKMVGPANTSFQRTRTSSGVEHVVLRADFYATFVLRQALKRLLFRPGNVVDLIVVDWPDAAVVAAGRLIITADFLTLLAA